MEMCMFSGKEDFFLAMDPPGLKSQSKMTYLIFTLFRTFLSWGLKRKNGVGYIGSWIKFNII